MNTPESLFVYVVEYGSFKKAAEYLKIEPSTLSRKIVKLEQRLQAKLLHRSTTKTFPTEIGKIYYEGLRKVISDQLALEETIFNSNNEIKGLLRISTTVDLGDNFVIPVIQKMQQQAPELNVELILGSNISDLVKNNIDVAIRIGDPGNPYIYAKHLGNPPRILVASKEYLLLNGAPKNPADLAKHNFILYSDQQSKIDIQFQNGSMFSHKKISSNIIVNSLPSILYMVKSGSGINWGPRWLYEEDLKSGELVEVLPLHPVKPFIINALYTTSEYLPYRTRWFLKLLQKKINFPS
jgi:DNA-binding transcriptional LysR family regulator